jgi:putative peptidoglycan lipid II flippase
VIGHATEILRRPAVGMAVATTGSRATGLLRTLALAWALGVGTLSDAYNVANTAPTMLFTLVAGGTITAAVVPLLSRGQTDVERRESASVIIGSLAVWGIAFSALMAIAAPLLMELLSAGASGERGDDLAELGTRWLRLFAPQVALYAVSAAATSVMAARRRLALGAAAGSATNLVVIAAALAFVAFDGTSPPADGVSSAGVAVLGWGTTAGVAAMTLIQLWGARRAEPGLRVRPSLRHPVVGELRRLGGWTVLYVAVNQLGYAAVVAMASAVAGGVTAYQWAFMLMQLPYAVVAVSILSSAYPRLAEAAAGGGDPAGIAVSAGRRTITWIGPAAVALTLLAAPVAVVVVGTAEADLVAAALAGFAASLVPFTVFQLLTRTSYATGDARGPAVLNIPVNAVMVAVDTAVLAGLDGERSRLFGLAVGHAVSYVAGCLLLGRRLGRRGFPVLGSLVRPAPSAIGATAAAGAAMIVLPVHDDTRIAALLSVCAVAGTGALVYVGVIRLVRGRAIV